MKFGKRLCAVFLLAGCVCITASAQSASWSGTWTLEWSSQDSLPTISIIQNSDGTSELRSGLSSFRFRCDGKPYPLVSRSTQKESGEGICNSLSNSTLDITYRIKEVPSNGHLQVSSDGKSLAYTLGSLDPTGKTPPTVRSYTRLSGTSGLLGGWKSVEGDSSRLLKINLSAHDITLEMPFAHHSAILPISGAEVHPMSNGVPSTSTEALQMDGPRMFRTIIRQVDGMVKQAVFILSSDGNTITEAGWVQQHPEQIVNYTYRRSHQ